MTQSVKVPKPKPRKRIASALERIADAIEALANRPMICDGCAKRLK